MNVRDLDNRPSVGMIAALASGLLLQQWVSFDLGKVAGITFPPGDTKQNGPYWIVLNEDIVARAGILSFADMNENRALSAYIHSLKDQHGAAKTIEGTDVLVKGWRGYHFTLDLKGGRLRGRAVAIGHSQVVAAEVFEYGEIIPNRQATEKFLDSLVLKHPNPNPHREATPPWSEYRGDGYTAMHTSDRFRGELIKGQIIVPNAMVSLIADRIFITGIAPLEKPVTTRAQLSDLRLQVERAFPRFEARLGDLDETNRPARAQAYLGPPMKVTCEGELEGGVYGRIVVNPVGDWLFIRFFAGPRYALSSRETARWFSTFRIEKATGN